MRMVTDELFHLNTFKDKTISDMNSLKTKLENYGNKTKIKIENGEKELK